MARSRPNLALTRLRSVPADLLDLLNRAAAGSWPPADGEVEVIGSPRGPADAVVAFTAHSVVAADVGEDWVRDHLPARDDLTGPMRPDFLARLGERLACRPGSLDVMLAAPGMTRRESEPDPLRPIAPGGAEHPRVARARLYRTDVQAFADANQRGLVILGRGLASRWEVAVELIQPAGGGDGIGRELLRAARTLVAPNKYLFAAVAPGNAQALRAALGAGFTPVGGEVLFLKERLRARRARSPRPWRSPRA
jgi:hypothetical protein